MQTFLNKTNRIIIFIKHKGVLTYFPTPKRVQDGLRQGTHPRVGLDVGGVQLDAFHVEIIVHVTLFLLFRDALPRIAAGFLFHFEKRVDVFLKQGVGGLREMPHLV